jgi:soluble lytic murein transglycosylase
MKRRSRSRAGMLSAAGGWGLLACVLTACRGPRVTPQPAPPPSNALPEPARSVLPAVAVPTIHPVLDDPRLVRTRVLAADHDWPSAAFAMTEAQAALTPDPRTSTEKCAWAYESGRLLLAAAQPREAAGAFDLARGASGDRGAPCPLAVYATYHAADAYLKASDFPAAESRARQVGPGSTVSDGAELVLASALAGEGRAADAIPLWRGALVKNPKAWVDVAVPLASALLDDASPSSKDDRETEALHLVTRVVVEVPKIADSSGAEALRKRAIARLRASDPKVSDELTVIERAQQARAWLDAGEPVKAAALATAIVSDPLVSTDPPTACAASIVRAQALGRTKAGAGTAWDDAIKRCEHDSALVTALYSGAKAAASKHPDIARERYAKVEELFHEHRLADDARFQGALLALSAGDEATFTRMMLSLPDEYPAGDQRTEALFRVAMLHMTRGEWVLAEGLLDRIVALSPDDQHWATAGRAEYFRARVAEKEGHAEDARNRYREVLSRHPFAYYMAQAYARLAESDVSLATRTLAAAFAHEEESAFLSSRHAELETPAFARACALLEVGDVDLARRELSLAGATRDDVDPEVAWTVALLYDRAGAPEVGHAFARQKLRDYLTHYPVGAWRTKWEIAYPRAFDDLVVQDSTASGIPVALTWAIMREESDFVADAKSGSNAFGLMQIIVPTAKGVARGTGLPFDEASLKQPRISVALGARLLGQLRSAFPDNPTLAIAAYNGGGGAVGRWITARGDEDFDLWVEEIPWEETRGYEKRVLSSEAAYAYLYDPAALDEVLRTSTRARGVAGARRLLVKSSDTQVAAP